MDQAGQKNGRLSGQEVDDLRPEKIADTVTGQCFDHRRIVNRWGQPMVRELCSAHFVSQFIGIPLGVADHGHGQNQSQRTAQIDQMHFPL